MHRIGPSRWDRVAVPGLVLVVLTACGRSTPSASAASPEQLSDSVVVVVTNNTEARLRVHGRYGSTDPFELGLVSIRRTESFLIPFRELGLHIGVRRADAQGEAARNPRWSEGVVVSARDSLEFTLNITNTRRANVTFRRVGRRGQSN